MTREEAIKIFGELLLFGKASCKKEVLKDLCKTALTALEQEPFIDKIRTEIMSLDYIDEDKYEGTSISPMIYRDDVLEILDKYKAESEKE